MASFYVSDYPTKYYPIDNYQTLQSLIGKYIFISTCSNHLSRVQNADLLVAPEEGDPRSKQVIVWMRSGDYGAASVGSQTVKTESRDTYGATTIGSHTVKTESRDTYGATTIGSHTVKTESQDIYGATTIGSHTVKTESRDTYGAIIIGSHTVKTESRDTYGATNIGSHGVETEDRDHYGATTCGSHGVETEDRDHYGATTCGSHGVETEDRDHYGAAPTGSHSVDTDEDCTDQGRTLLPCRLPPCLCPCVPVSDAPRGSHPDTKSEHAGRTDLLTVRIYWRHAGIQLLVTSEHPLNAELTMADTYYGVIVGEAVLSVTTKSRREYGGDNNFGQENGGDSYLITDGACEKISKHERPTTCREPIATSDQKAPIGETDGNGKAGESVGPALDNSSTESDPIVNEQKAPIGETDGSSRVAEPAGVAFDDSSTGSVLEIDNAGSGTERENPAHQTNEGECTLVNQSRFLDHSGGAEDTPADSAIEVENVNVSQPMEERETVGDDSKLASVRHDYNLAEASARFCDQNGGAEYSHGGKESAWSVENEGDIDPTTGWTMESQPPTELAEEAMGPLESSSACSIYEEMKRDYLAESLAEALSETLEYLGAIGSMKGELEKAGCKVNIHGKSTNSSDVDNKIRQLKWTMRSVLVLPFYFPVILTAALVAFCVAKINMTPSRANLHWYSPYDILLGRPLLVDRDLGGKGGNGPLSFCSRVEIFDHTSNTMAERTTPALFLGSKGNNYGSGLFFKLDTETIVASDQWKSLPMDAGTIARVNAITKKRPLFPKRIPMYYGGKEVQELPVEEIDTEYKHDSPYIGRIVMDSGEAAPTGATEDSYSPERELEIVSADTAIEAESSSQLTEENEAVIENDSAGHVRFFDQSGGAESTSGGNVGAEEARSGEIGGAVGTTPGRLIDDSTRYHHPALDDSSRSNPVGALWFMPGKAVEPTEGIPQRVKKAPERLTYDSFVVSEPLLRDVITIMDPANRRAVGNRMPYRPSVGRSRAEQAEADHRCERHHSSQLRAVDRAINQFGGKAIESLHKELSGLHKKKVFSQVLLQDLSVTQKRSIIRSKMFLKEKFFPDGTFDKLKSRLVVGGDMQIRSNYSEEETSSPTVSLSSVYLVLSVAAKEKRKVGTADVGMAYLNTTIGKPVYMRIDKRLSQMLVELFPESYQLDVDGCIYVKLSKALYGCVESAKLWYDEVSSALISLGFSRNPHDICVFNINRNGHQVSVCLYVDDLLVTSVDESDIEWVVSEMRKKYESVTLTSGLVHSYLGQTFDLSTPGEVSVSMEGYIRDVLDASGVKGYNSTPASEDLYVISETATALEKSDLEDFHSMVMRLMFLAQRARPDILTQVVYKPTGEMIADIMTKPLQGEFFRRMRAGLLGMDYPDESEVSKGMQRRAT